MSRGRLIAVICLLGLLAAGVIGVLWHGERLERRLLGWGGRIVQSAAQQPARTLALFGAGVTLTWLALAVVSIRQSPRANDSDGPASEPAPPRE